MESLFTVSLDKIWITSQLNTIDAFWMTNLMFTRSSLRKYVPLFVITGKFILFGFCLEASKKCLVFFSKVFLGQNKHHLLLEDCHSQLVATSHSPWLSCLEILQEVYYSLLLLLCVIPCPGYWCCWRPPWPSWPCPGQAECHHHPRGGCPHGSCWSSRHPPSWDVCSACFREAPCQGRRPSAWPCSRRGCPPPTSFCPVFVEQLVCNQTLLRISGWCHHSVSGGLLHGQCHCCNNDITWLETVCNLLFQQLGWKVNKSHRWDLKIIEMISLRTDVWWEWYHYHHVLSHLSSPRLICHHM